MVATVGVGAFVAFIRTQPVPRRLSKTREVFLRHLAQADRRSVVAAMRGASRSDLPSEKEAGGTAVAGADPRLER